MTIKDDLIKKGVVQRGHFKLSSGFHSDTYINKDLIYVYPDLYDRLSEEIASSISDNMYAEQVDVIVGLEKGSIPLASAIAILVDRSFVYADKKNNNFMFRKSYIPFIAEKKIVIIEDILTTGKSLLKAIRAVEKIGGEVTNIFCIWNRNAKLSHINNLKINSLINEKVGYWRKEECSLCSKRKKFTVIK